MTPQQISVIDRLAPTAVKLETSHGIPAFLMIGQICLESNFLLNAPGNNCLGAKDYAGAAGRQLLPTYENFTDAGLRQFLGMGDGRCVIEKIGPAPGQTGSMIYRVKDFFATFPSVEECMAWRAQRFKNGLDAANGGNNQYAWILDYANGSKDRGSKLALSKAVAKTYATANPESYAVSVVAIGDSPEANAAIEAAR